MRIIVRLPLRFEQIYGKIAEFELVLVGQRLKVVKLVFIKFLGLGNEIERADETPEFHFKIS